MSTVLERREKSNHAYEFFFFGGGGEESKRTEEIMIRRGTKTPRKTDKKRNKIKGGKTTKTTA